MGDLSEYLVNKYCERAKNRVAHSSLKGGLFEPRGRSFFGWNDFHITVNDYGETIDILVDNKRNGSISELAEKLKSADLTVPEDYVAIISHVGYRTVKSEDGEELIMTVRPRIKKGKSGRKHNKEKIYNCFERCALSKLMLEVYKLS